MSDGSIEIENTLALDSSASPVDGFERGQSVGTATARLGAANVDGLGLIFSIAASPRKGAG
jgi:hypothetical protein